MNSRAMQLPAETTLYPGLQRWLRESWRELGCAPAALPAFELALEESFINVATHGVARAGRALDVNCRLVADDAGATLTISDDGQPFNPLDRTAPAVDAPLETRPLGGVGIALIRRLIDEVAYRRVDGRNELTLRQRHGPGPARDRPHE